MKLNLKKYLMKRTSIFNIIIFFVTFFLHLNNVEGQDFQATIYLKNGNQHLGLVQEKSFKEFSEFVYFKKPDTKKFVKYTAYEIDSLVLKKGVKFIRKEISGNPKPISKLLLIRNQGPIQFLVLYNSNKSRFFIEKNNSLQELTKTEQIINGVKRVKRPYRSTLAKAMSDQYEILEEIKILSFKESSFSSLIHKYNSKIEPNSKNFKVYRKLQVGFGISYMKPFVL